eukprot:5656497-Pleurochrysis_carterae.AAC.1
MILLLLWPSSMSDVCPSTSVTGALAGLPGGNDEEERSPPKAPKGKTERSDFAWACNVVQYDGPQSQTKLASRRRQAPITKTTSNRKRRKPATQVLQPLRCSPPSRRSVRGPSRAALKGVGHVPQGNSH